MRSFAVLCVGQGSQWPGMFDFPLGHASGREVLEACRETTGFDLVARARAGDRLFDNAFAQPALVASTLATWAVLKARLPEPSLFAGYSVGELSAWGCAGAWEPRTCAALATTRARVMDASTPPGCGMISVRGLRREETTKLAEGLHPAIVSGFDHVVLAGDDAGLVAASARLTGRGATIRRLDVGVPSHTPILRDASRAFHDALADVPPRDVAVPVLRGIDGRPCTRGADGAAALAQALSRTIRWDRCQRQMTESGVDVLLELGPGHALTRIASEADPPLAARSVSDFRSLDGVVDWMLKRLED